MFELLRLLKEELNMERLEFKLLEDVLTELISELKEEREDWATTEEEEMLERELRVEEITVLTESMLEEIGAKELEVCENCSVKLEAALLKDSA